MPLLLLVMMSLGIVLAAVLQCIAPQYARPGLFFGATVEPEFPGSEKGRWILRRYRWTLIVTSVLIIVALWLAVPRLSGFAPFIATTSAVFLEVSVAILSIPLASRQVRAWAKPQSPTRTVRTVSMIPRKRTLPGGWLPLFGPLLIVGAARLLLFTRRESMPHETYQGALALLLVPFVWNALFMWLAWLAMFRTRQINSGGAPANEENAGRRMGYLVRLLNSYFLTVLMVPPALAAARITTAVPGPRFMVIVMAFPLALGMIVMAYVVKRRRLARDTPVVAIGDSTPDGCWTWGIIYHNPDDPALVVETRVGRFGCDLNFGNKWSWVVSGVILSTPFVTPLLWF
jgi:uncharacterized membrane protein